MEVAPYICEEVYKHVSDECKAQYVSCQIISSNYISCIFKTGLAKPSSTILILVDLI